MYKLGLASGPVTMKYNDQEIVVEEIPLEVQNIRPAFRIGREGRQVDQVVITLTQPFALNR
jgi:hypothetical protein